MDREHHGLGHPSQHLQLLLPRCCARRNELLDSSLGLPILRIRRRQESMVMIQIISVASEYSIADGYAQDTRQSEEKVGIPLLLLSIRHNSPRTAHSTAVPKLSEWTLLWIRILSIRPATRQCTPRQFQGHIFESRLRHPNATQMLRESSLPSSRIIPFTVFLLRHATCSYLATPPPR